jgi:hypothetical protein
VKRDSQVCGSSSKAATGNEAHRGDFSDSRTGHSDEASRSLALLRLACVSIFGISVGHERKGNELRSPRGASVPGIGLGQAHNNHIERIASDSLCSFQLVTLEAGNPTGLVDQELEADSGRALIRRRIGRE